VRVLTLVRVRQRRPVQALSDGLLDHSERRPGEIVLGAFALRLLGLLARA
jgi:hypothetical protein